MQQHPIPQNITGFEFKLIGDMTVKQFAYLAGGAAFAYLTFVSAIHPLVKFPLVIFFGLLGVALAFLPVEGRPLDRWIINFIRALFTPSQYIFHKDAPIPEFLKTYAPRKVVPATKGDPQKPVQPFASAKAAPQKSEKITAFIQSVSQPYPPIDKERQERLAKITTLIQEVPSTPPVKPAPLATNISGTPAPIAYSQPNPIQTLSTRPTQVDQPMTAPILSGFSIPYQPPTPAPPATPPPQRKAVEQKLKEERLLSQENEKLKEELVALKEKVATPQETTPHNQLMQEALGIEKRLQEALSEKERLASELTSLKSRLGPKTATQPVTPMPPQKPTQSEKVRIVAPYLITQTGITSLPHVPNIVSGIVKDAKGDILPNIIVEVKDATNTPVRAFKTNKLGQFSGATPLANGKYTFELEDPKNTYSFDVIGIELTGAAFQPIEIRAKDTSVNDRSQIYQSLFGTKPATSN